MSDVGKGDGLGIANDQVVIVNQLEGIVKSLTKGRRAFKAPATSRVDAGTHIQDALNAAKELLADLRKSLKRLERTETLVVSLNKLVNPKKRKKR